MTQQPSPPKTEALLGIAARPVFPFFILKFDQTDEGNEDYIINIKVRPEIYNYIRGVFSKDEVVFYLDPLIGKIEAWTPDMHASFELINRLGLMDTIRVWIQKARTYLCKALPIVSPR